MECCYLLAKTYLSLGVATSEQTCVKESYRCREMLLSELRRVGVVATRPLPLEVHCLLFIVTKEEEDSTRVAAILWICALKLEHWTFAALTTPSWSSVNAYTSLLQLPAAKYLSIQSILF